MALSKNGNKSVPVEEKNNAVAFANWSIQKKDGSEIRSSKGFPIFQNPKYPNKKEDMLVELAKRNGGTVTLNMKVTISLNRGSEEVDLDDIAVVSAEVDPYANAVN